MKTLTIIDVENSISRVARLPDGHFIHWRWRTIDQIGTMGKCPCTCSGIPMDANDRKNWLSLDAAIGLIRMMDVPGLKLGYVINENGRYVLDDLFGLHQPKSGHWALDHVAKIE